MAPRRKIPAAIKQAVLLEAGYKCGNPACRHVLTLEMHHIEWVRDGGENEVENLLALCPNCHAQHTAGQIPSEAIRVWKGVLASLMNPHRASADVLLAIWEDHRRVASAVEPSAPPFRFSGDSLGFLAGLLTSRLVVIGRRFSGASYFGGGAPNFEINLTATGQMFVEGWRAGSSTLVTKALGNEVVATMPTGEPAGDIDQ